MLREPHGDRLLLLSLAMVTLLALQLSGGCSDLQEVGASCHIKEQSRYFATLESGFDACESSQCLQVSSPTSNQAMCTTQCSSNEDCEEVADDTSCTGGFWCMYIPLDLLTANAGCCKLCACVDQVPKDTYEFFQDLCKDKEPSCP